MKNSVTELEILNFKSLRDVRLNCERINLFVGKPNVGKSNLLEALALLGPNFLNKGEGFGKPLLRYEQAANLFYDQNYMEEDIVVKATGLGTASILANNSSQFDYEMQRAGIGSVSASFQMNGQLTQFNIDRNRVFSPVKPYQFPEKQQFVKGEPWLFLSPPDGKNLPEILQVSKNIRQEISRMLEAYGLQLFVKGNQLDLTKNQDGVLFETPFSLVADTLRRYIFHFAAIESNRDSILLFEEPESHHFPPYITRLAQKIIAAQTNQFFITTHSPFLFNILIEESADVAVFWVDYDNFQTKVRRLTDENLRELLDYGLNIFTEHELFV